MKMLKHPSDEFPFKAKWNLVRHFVFLYENKNQLRSAWFPIVSSALDKLKNQRHDIPPRYDWPRKLLLSMCTPSGLYPCRGSGFTSLLPQGMCLQASC